MKPWHQLLLKSLSGLISFFFIYVVISTIIFKDFTTSLAPGWHTTIYPFGGALNFAIVIALITILVNLIFKLAFRLLTFISDKILKKR